MKDALYKKLPEYLIQFAAAASLIFIGLGITISAATFIQATIGLIILSITISTVFMHTLREILYWASYKDEPDKCEDDLPNQP